jgi:acetyl esterase/lipase
VVWIHGGGWLNGTREFTPETVPRLFEMVTDAGFAVASLDYRLAGEAVFPAQLDDVRTATGWLRSNAGQLGIDTDRIAVWGESAGGHLASLLALTAEPPDRPDCAVVFYAPSDLLSIASQTPGAEAMDPFDNPVSRMLGGPPDQLPDAARAASPTTYAHAQAPPMLLVHGDADTSVPIAQSQLLADRLREVGATVVFETVPGADHIFAGHPEPHDMVARAIEFTAQYLGTP